MPGSGRQRCAALACVLIAAALTSFAQTSEPSSPQTAAQPKSQPTAKSRKSKKSRKTASSRKRGQQKIDAQRTRQIQEALIREHYLSGKPSGAWDSTTQAAMQKFQADNGWQSKTTPDARALIKMGLGPDHDHLLNPESAMTSQLPASSPTKTGPTSDSSKPQK
jgi:hypothetical protein